MERTRSRMTIALGAAVLLAGVGCQSAWHRRGVPPEPPRAGEGGAQFSSDPHPAQSAATGPVAPTGPVNGTAGPYSRGGMYGGGAESGGMPSAAPPQGTMSMPAGTPNI